jgi:hypothetical protein
MIAAEIRIVVDTSLFFRTIDAQEEIDKISWQTVRNMEVWCRKKFGKEARERDQVSDEFPWCTRYYNGIMWWYFAREEYATMFALRWL